MEKKIRLVLILGLTGMLVWAGMAAKEQQGMKFTGAKGEVKIMTLDPGHFHAALVQKSMYDQVSPQVSIYAPAGPDLSEHLARVESYNKRADNPTRWENKVFTGADFLEKMLAERPGNVMVTAGNNRKKTEYLKKTLDAGIHVLSDKPMCIDPAGFALLQKAFASAREKNLLLYDIMTERYEITSILQKELASMPAVFGKLLPGTPGDPSVVKESVHHFFKSVSGKPLKRPAWFYDVTQQGEGIVDVTTHLVDLVMWASFPEQAMDHRKDVEMVGARRWETRISREQFSRSTGLEGFPPFLQPNVGSDGQLSVFSNGEIQFQLRGVHSKVSVIWNYEAPPGGGDTHYSVMKGTLANVLIRQGKEQNYIPELYVEAAKGSDAAQLSSRLEKAIPALQARYPGIRLEKISNSWHIVLPEKYRVGHEAHFGQVTEKFLQYLVAGRLPEWETSNMITKYFITTRAFEMAHRK